MMTLESTFLGKKVYYQKVPGTVRAVYVRESFTAGTIDYHCCLCLVVVLSDGRIIDKPSMDFRTPEEIG